MTNETEILASLDPKTRKRIQLAQEYELERQPTPSVGLNFGLKGGFAYGRQVLVWGSKSAGKTTFCLELMAQAQKEGKTCALIDAEGTFDQAWGNRLGLDSSKLLISDSNHVAKVADDAVDLVKAGVDILLIDSISTILSSAYFDKSDEMKPFADTGQIGTQAKDLGKMSNMILGVNEHTLVILISQQRNMITPMYTKLQPMGGQAITFNSSTIVKLWSSESDAKALTGELQSGDKLYTEKIGKTVTWDIEKNKTGPEGPTGSYDFYYQGEKVGVDSVAEVIDLALKYGFIEETSKGWYLINGNKVQGRPGVLRTVKEDETLFNTLRERIYDQSK